MPGGRPPIELTELDLKTIELTAAHGMTQAETCQILPFADRTLRDKIKKHPEVSAAYTRGRLSYKRRLLERLKMIAVDGEKDADALKAIQYILDRQFGWAEPEDDSTDPEDVARRTREYLARIEATNVAE